MAIKFCWVVKAISSQLLVKKNLQIFLMSSAEHAPKNLIYLIRILQYETFILNQVNCATHIICSCSFNVRRAVWCYGNEMQIV